MQGSILSYVISDWIARRIPYPAIKSIACGLAWVYQGIGSRDIAIVSANLHGAFPHYSKRELHVLAKRVISSYAEYLCDLACSERINERFIREFVQIEGRHYLDESLARGKGMIVVSAHLGNWELGGMVASFLGYPVTAFAAQHVDARIEALFRRRRVHSGMQTISAESFLKQCYRLLWNNEVLAMNVDRLFVGEGLPVPFMGKVVEFPFGYVKLAQKTGAAVIPVFFVKETDGRYRFIIHKPLNTIDEREMVREYAVQTEFMIRRYPEQWFVFSPFWERMVRPQ